MTVVTRLVALEGARCQFHSSLTSKSKRAMTSTREQALTSAYIRRVTVELKVELEIEPFQLKSFQLYSHCLYGSW